ncbi:hypothetical protein C882_2476 [Caenispirillum salinarum AK4]|uniref:SPOR domain-containing protein n=1 Tax=Caenispirillum salinarum AK4 TaxID=1238182 RepID=K9H492_9PROT|nr:SPOR domain-containing protein [Caenispirillum salinarum]EKV32397.1 hypothetical protein C882_2476 [Caenispirillum salinarum AK4]
MPSRALKLSASVLLLPLALGACAAGSLKEPAAGSGATAAGLLDATAPRYQADDTWSYRAATGDEVVEKVIAVRDDGTVLWAATDGRRWEAVANPLLPPLRTLPEAGPRLANTFTPPAAELDLFPLTPGKTAAFTTQTAAEQDGRVEKTTESQCQVRGPREVTVPAGTFETVEVFCRHGGRFETLYYAPKVRNTVMELRDVDGRMEKKELVAYRPSATPAPAEAVPEAAPMPGDPAPQAAAVEAEALDTPQAQAQPQPQPAQADPSQTAARPADAPGWTLQLAALSSREAADKAWAQWQTAVQRAVPGAEAAIAQGNGLWRLTTGRFETRTDAAAACAKLKADDVQCFPKEL